MNQASEKPGGERPDTEGRGFDLQAAYLVMIRAYLRKQRQAQKPANEVKHA